MERSSYGTPFQVDGEAARPRICTKMFWRRQRSTIGKRSSAPWKTTIQPGICQKTGIAAKIDCEIEVFEIPKRSPDLNVLDYAIWSKVETLMRAQERGWPDSKRETREQFEKRLDRTALTLDPAFINKCILIPKERCKRLYDAKGGLFEEGGWKSRRPL